MKIIYHPSVIDCNKIIPKRDELSKLSVIGEAIEIDFNVIPYIRGVHSERHISKVRGACLKKTILAEVPTRPELYTAALNSVGLAIMASNNSDFAITIPPGHHARPEEVRGFCFFNNIAIGVQKLIEEGERICIIDIDGHHGDGTEKIFYKSNKVIYFSVHQEGSFPNNTGKITDIGSGKGKGFNFNIPIPSGSRDDILIRCLKFSEPYIKKFNPNRIGVSAGFDGFVDDRLLNLEYTTRGFHEAGRIIAEWGHPVFGVLEGGYHQRVLECLSSFVAGINNDKIYFDKDISLSEEDIKQRVNSNLERIVRKLENENLWI